ncbi:hypothetical protein BDV23DRAFT_52253 [Aspergillus alliaceus]|uniref:Ubiquitin-like protease family profile domain-containing protein n=1 Tax=Petromyces alliaceus TaxID=209559 RepID=A0A5N7CFT2_PETAA|nr:hypothetical protein BDV23DRAFT_52253 [Aspergillus alliaceus]
MFGRISELLSNWIPSEPTESRPTTANLFPFDVTSDQVRRTQTSGERNESLPVDSSFDTLIHCLNIQSPHSYAERPQSSQSVRLQSRQTIPQPGVGMRRLLGEDKSTRSQKRPPTQNDEERLLPGHAVRSDPGAVKIVPGSVGQKVGRKSKVNIPSSFKPYNTLSGRARESGPVRARGKSERGSGNQRGPGSSITHPENGVVNEHQERPSKRRRRESQDTSGGVISISDDDIMEQLPPDNTSSAGHSTRLSPSLSQRSGKAKPRDSSSKRNKVDEYRNVERSMRPPRTPNQGSKKNHQLSSGGDHEERSSENAVRERRALAFNVDPEQTKLAWPDRAVKHEMIPSIEIPPYSPAEQQTGLISRTQQLTTNQKRPDGSRDSPDELQGDATVERAPVSLRQYQEDEIMMSKSEAEERPSTIGRLSSPSDIQPTVFTSSSQRHRKSDKRRTAPASREKSAVKIFYATFVRVGSSERRLSDAFEIGVETTEPIIILPWNGKKLSLQRLDKVLQGNQPSCKVRLKFSRKGGLDDEMDIEFSTSEEQETFCNLLQGLLRGQQVHLFYKSNEWLRKAFDRTALDLENKTNESERFGENNQKPIVNEAPEVARRVKLSDSLQDGNGHTAGKMQSTGTASMEHSKPSTTKKTMETSNAGGTGDISSNSKQQGGVEIPMKRFHPELSSSNRAATRSMSRRAPATTVVCDDGAEDDNPQPKPDNKGKKWNKPLVYPRFGKKKAEVDAQDRERLRDNEFLNDNLIGFYMRFLEDHLERTNKEVAKRVYFFNSYFFATLTNAKGRRNINYEGVQKWTRAVDIFGFDYIVVPINENAHWYVAIICNLPNLPGIANERTGDPQSVEYDKGSSAAPDSEAREIPETPEPIEQFPAGKETNTSHRDLEPAKDAVTLQSFESMSLSDKEELKDGAHILPPTEWPEQEENLTFSPAKFYSPAAKVESSQKLDTKDNPGLATSPRKGPKKKGKVGGKPGGTKFDTHQTIIVTFDSLDLSRSPTICNLRDYLYEEAKSKRGIEIEKGLIKGMRARAIPLQPNYSDCGLYLLAYVEKFVQDPDLFFRKLLRKEMKTEDDWPPLKSGLLRRRLRGFLDDLYDEQAQLGPEKPSEKKTMADRQPVSYLLGSYASISTEGLESDDARVGNSAVVEPALQKPPHRKQGPAASQSASADLKTGRVGAQRAASSKNLSSARVEVSVPNASKDLDDNLVEVQVPDSQEQVQEVSAPSPKTVKEQDGSLPSGQAAMDSVEDQDLIRTVEYRGKEKAAKTGQPMKPQKVEVQITQSPYLSNIKNPRSTKQSPR